MLVFRGEDSFILDGLRCFLFASKKVETFGSVGGFGYVGNGGQPAATFIGGAKVVHLSRVDHVDR